MKLNLIFKNLDDASKNRFEHNHSSATDARTLSTKDKGLAWMQALEQVSRIDYSQWFSMPGLSTATYSVTNSLSSSAPSPSVSTSSLLSFYGLSRPHAPVGQTIQDSPHRSKEAEITGDFRSLKRGPVDEGACLSNEPVQTIQATSNMLNVMVGSTAPENLKDVTNALHLIIERSFLCSANSADLQVEVPLQGPTFSFVDASVLSEPVTRSSFDLVLDEVHSSPTSSSTEIKTVSAGDQEAPIRFYAEWTEQGLHLWLGISGSQTPLIDPILQNVQRWLLSRGERLHKVVCNGKEVRHDSIYNPTALDLLDSSGTSDPAFS